MERNDAMRKRMIDGWTVELKCKYCPKVSVRFGVRAIVATVCAFVIVAGNGEMRFNITASFNAYEESEQILLNVMMMGNRNYLYAFIAIRLRRL